MIDRPASLDDMVNHTVGRVLDLFGLDAGLVRRWTGRPPAAAHAPFKEGADLRNRCCPCSARLHRSPAHGWRGAGD